MYYACGMLSVCSLVVCLDIDLACRSGCSYLYNGIFVIFCWGRYFSFVVCPIYPIPIFWSKFDHLWSHLVVMYPTNMSLGLAGITRWEDINRLHGNHVGNQQQTSEGLCV